MEDQNAYFRTRPDAEIDASYRPAFVNVEREVLGLRVEEGLVLRPVFGRNLTVSFVYMEPHSVAPVHQHPQEQIGTIVEGGYEFELAGEKRMVRRGDVYVVPPNVTHGAVTHDEHCLAIDVFSPPREMLRELMDRARAERSASDQGGEK